MLKKLLVACVGTAVLLAAGVAFAGVPCAGTSDCDVSVLHKGTTSCDNTEGAFCPLGDQDTAKVEVTIRDCYGNLLAGRTVTVSPPATGFFFCQGDQVVVTDAFGVATAYYHEFGGCGFVQFEAESEGAQVLSNLIYSANMDNDSPANGSVSLSDFARFSSGYGGTDPRFDYNCDGNVTLSDFAKFSSHYGHTCPPL